MRAVTVFMLHGRGRIPGGGLEVVVVPIRAVCILHIGREMVGSTILLRRSVLVIGGEARERRIVSKLCRQRDPPAGGRKRLAAVGLIYAKSLEGKASSEQ